MWYRKKVGRALRELLSAPVSMETRSMVVPVVLLLRHPRRARFLERNFQVSFVGEMLPVAAADLELPELRGILRCREVLFADHDPLVEGWLPRPARASGAHGALDRDVYRSYNRGRLRELRGSGVTVALPDTGVATGHPLIPSRIVRYDVTGEEPGRADTVGHGTFIASLLVGRGEHGLVPAARLVSIRVFDSLRRTSRSRLLRAMEIALQEGAQVFSASYGSPEPDPILRVGYEHLVRRGGVTLVAAAGNAAHELSYPAAYHDISISVGAVDRAGRLAPWSGREPDILCPAVGIIGAQAPGTSMGEPAGAGLTRASGTSFSTPVAAAMAGKIVQLRRKAAPGEVKQILVRACSPAN